MSRTTTYAYDLGGNIVEKILPNLSKEVRTHDGRNRVSTLKNQSSGSTDVAGYSYSYDKAGNVMEVVEDYPAGDLAGRTITNGYDGVYRLLTETIATTGGSMVTTTYVYDKGHNRTSKTAGGVTTSYVIGNGNNGGGANQIVSSESIDGETIFETASYGYDDNGNRHYEETSGDSSSSSSSGGGTKLTIYQYDDENRLINLNVWEGSDDAPYAYAYDYRTRRVERTEPGPVTTHIVFDGGVSIEEYTSSAGSPTVEYIRGHDYGGGVGGLEYSVRSSEASFNFYDSRGDLTTKTSISGGVTYQTGYEAFGNQTVSSGTTPLDRQRANTKEQDPTGLLNEGMRYRDPSTGTFLTRDPLGFKAGPNMYTYVHQNPWTHFDPEGLDNNQPNPPPPPPPAIPNVAPSRNTVIRKEDSTRTSDVLAKGYPAPQTNAKASDIALGNAKDPGMKPASTNPAGAPNIKGDPLRIDVGLTQKAGGAVVSQQQVQSEMPGSSARTQMYKTGQQVNKEAEVIVKGPVPPEAITPGTGLAVKALGKAAMVAGVAITAKNLVDAGGQSIATGSPKPILKQVAREAGGWSGALAGAAAGGAIGAAAGVETGPGLLVTGFVGSVIGGTLGYFGASSAVKHL